MVTQVILPDIGLLPAVLCLVLYNAMMFIVLWSIYTELHHTKTCIINDVQELKTTLTAERERWSLLIQCMQIQRMTTHPPQKNEDEWKITAS
jgi:hypothetical protein